MTCCEPTDALSERTYVAHRRAGTEPCEQSRADRKRYRSALPPRPTRAQGAKTLEQASARDVVDPDDWSDSTSDVREAERERAAAVQWLEDSFTAEEAALHLRRLSTS